MPKAKAGAKTRTSHPSATKDSAKPGSPTSMDVMVGWLTIPGNVARWQGGNKAALSRDVVGLMQKAGIAHRQTSYVRYKLDALLKQFLKAKKWLVETAMYDAFVRGKADKDVKASIKHMCPTFLTLDPAMKDVSLGDKKSSQETIELDGDSTEDNAEEREEIVAPSSDEELEDAVALPLFEKDTEKQPEKKKPGRSRKADVEDANTARKKSPLNAAAVAAKAALQDDTAQQAKDTKKKPTEKPGPAASKKAPATSSRKVKDAVKPMSSGKAASTSKPTAAARDTPAAKSAATAPVKRPAKPSPVITPIRATTSAQTTSAAKPTAAAQDTTVEKPATAAPATAAAKAPAPVQTTSGAKSTAAEPVAARPAKLPSGAKRKAREKSPSPAKRTRIHEEHETTQEELDHIEREAALQRLQNDEKQRQQIFELERAKVACELEAKQVQVMFEKVAARKKLQQMGVSQVELDRIFPL